MTKKTGDIEKGSNNVKRKLLLSSENTFKHDLIESLKLLEFAETCKTKEPLFHVSRKFNALRRNCNNKYLLSILSTFSKQASCSKPDSSNIAAGDTSTSLPVTSSADVTNVNKALITALQVLIETSDVSMEPKATNEETIDAETQNESSVSVAAVNDTTSSKQKIPDATGGKVSEETNKPQRTQIFQLRTNTSPNVHLYLSILVIVQLIDRKNFEELVGLATLVTTYLQSLPRHTADEWISSKIYFYYSYAYELSGRLSEVRNVLLRVYRVACLQHSFLLQAVILNLLLRNYIHCNLYNLASKLVSKTSFPQNLRSNAQSARYLFYTGRLQAVQLAYSDAYDSLMQAIRKVTSAKPQSLPKSDNADNATSKSKADNAKKETVQELKVARRKQYAKGFRSIATKFALIVQVLMGDIPDRTIFAEKDLKSALVPYKAIVEAVRAGDLTAFDFVLKNHESQFRKDGCYFLVRRIHQNVIKTALRKISLAYSLISLDDVAQKLGLETTEEAECIIAKAVSDGVVDVKIDRDAGCIESAPRSDIFATLDPSEAYNRRIRFCLQLHNEAVESMRYPEDKKNTEEKTNEAEAKRKELQEQLARVEDSDDVDDVDML